MKRKELPSDWVVDYSAARAHAIRWLGDRYLLAKSINASHYPSRRPPLAAALSSTPAASAVQSQSAPANAAFPVPPLASCS